MDNNKQTSNTHISDHQYLDRIAAGDSGIRGAGKVVFLAPIDSILVLPIVVNG